MSRLSAPALIVCFLAPAVPPSPAAEPDKKDGPYTWKAVHDPNGIGKFYMGREIAQVMGHAAASWLERPERVTEEEPAKLLKLLGLKPGMVVADIGAGSGYYTFRIAPLVGERGKVLAVDIQKEMLDLIRDKAARKKVANVEAVQGEEKDPKLPEGGLDLIMMVDVYHEFAFPLEMTRHLVKALKPDGRLVFVEFRLEDENVPIKLVHKMSQDQVRKEMEPFKELRYQKTYNELPWQHVIVFTKVEPKNE